MKIPRNLVYKERISWDKFEREKDGTLDKALYNELFNVEGLFAECPDFQSRGDFHLEIFNDAYYIVTLSSVYQNPEEKLNDFAYIAGQANWSARHYNHLDARPRAVMGMVYAMLSFLGKDEKRRRLADTIFLEMFKGQEYENVAISMRKSIASVYKMPSFDFVPVPLSERELKLVDWEKHIRLYSVNDVDTDPILSNIPEISPIQEIDELIDSLGRNWQEKMKIVDALEKYLQTKDNDRYCNYDGAKAYIPVKREWLKQTKSLHQQESAPLQLVFPELHDIYDETFPPEEERGLEQSIASNPMTPEVEELKASLEKEKLHVAELTEEIEQLKQDIAELEEEHGLATMPRAAIFYAAAKIVTKNQINKDALAQTFKNITGLGGEKGERVRQAYSESLNTKNKFTEYHKEKAIEAVKDVIPELVHEIKKINVHTSKNNL